MLLSYYEPKVDVGSMGDYTTKRQHTILLVSVLCFLGCGWDPTVGNVPQHAPGDTRESTELLRASTTQGVETVPADATRLPIPADTGLDEQIGSIVLQTKAARQHIRSYRMEIRWHERQFSAVPVDTPLPEGEIVSEGEGTWIQDGEKWLVHHPRRRERVSMPQKQMGIPPAAPPLSTSLAEFKYWAVFNGDYYANRRTQNGDNLNFYSKAMIDAGLINVGPDLFPFPLKWGFGDGYCYLDEEFERSGSTAPPRPVRWEMERFNSEDGPKIRLVRLTRLEDRGYDRKTEFVVDPERDFLVVYTGLWESDAEKLFEIRTVLQELVDGRWYPERSTIRRRNSYQEWEFSNVEFNPQLEPSMFSIDSFDVDPNSTRMYRRNAGNSSTTYLFKEGQWIPESMVPKHLRPKQLGEAVQFSSENVENRK